MRRLFTLLLLALFVMPLYAQRRPKPGVETVRLSENFYRLFIHEFVAMLVFTGPEGILLVDTGMDPVDLIQAELDKIGGGPVRYIINTHSNGDHILGNAVLGPDAIIVASAPCREDILKREDFPESGLPNLILHDSMTIRFNDETIGLYFMPGHTGNDVVVHFERANIVCVGDLVFSDSFPGTQVSRGGNAYELEKTLARIITLFPKDATFVVSHVRDYTMEEMKAYHAMTRETIDAVTSLIEQGLSLEAIKARRPLKAWASWNSTFFPGEVTEETWIENIVESYPLRQALYPPRGPFLGQRPPGLRPELFAPGIISSGMNDMDITFTRDGSELFFSRSSPNWTTAVLHMKQEGDTWIGPSLAPFPNAMSFVYPFACPAADQLYMDNREDVFLSQKSGETWSAPVHWESGRPEDGREGFVSVASSGNLYLSADYGDSEGSRDIYVSEYLKGVYTEPQVLGAGVNTEFHEFHACISPDERYILFDSPRPGGYGRNDLYISFRDKDGAWLPAKNLGEAINTASSDMRPYVTSDGRYLFFCSDRSLVFPEKTNLSLSYDQFMARITGPGNGSQDIYWVDARILETFAPEN